METVLSSLREAEHVIILGIWIGKGNPAEDEDMNEMTSANLI